MKLRAYVVVAVAALTAVAAEETGCRRGSPAAPTADLVAGLYAVTFTASKSCQLPSEAMSRTYSATITPTSGGLTAVLSGAQFWTGFHGIVWNTMFLELHGDSVILKVNDIDYAFYYGAGIAEQLTDSEVLVFYGTGEAPALASSFTVTFAGTVSLATPPLISDTHGLVATCAAPDHQLVFTRIS